jgi:hypothetical protein
VTGPVLVPGYTVNGPVGTAGDPWANRGPASTGRVDHFFPSYTQAVLDQIADMSDPKMIDPDERPLVSWGGR